MERWIPIEEFEGLYEVSNLGNVRSITREVDFGNQTRVSKGRVLIPNNNGNGYFYVSLSNKEIQTREYIHRLVAKAFLKNKYEKPEVNHIDGDKANNRSDNLEWVTESENRDHAYRTGLNKGKPSESSIVDVNMIIDLIKLNKYTKEEIKRVFKISENFYYKVMNHDDYLNKMFNDNKEKRMGKSGRVILILDKENNKTYEFDSARAAARTLGFYDGYFSEIVTKRGGETTRFKVSYI